NTFFYIWSSSCTAYLACSFSLLRAFDKDFRLHPKMDPPRSCELRLIFDSVKDYHSFFGRVSPQSLANFPDIGYAATDWQSETENAAQLLSGIRGDSDFLLVRRIRFILLVAILNLPCFRISKISVGQFFRDFQIFLFPCHHCPQTLDHFWDTHAASPST
ncbi:hypothetical protein EDD64_1051, partial [Effusibacillus lacus]